MAKLSAITMTNDTQQIRRALMMAERLLSDPELFRVEYLRLRSWVAVPVESASHFDSLDTSRLLPAMSLFGSDECFAVVTDKVKHGPKVYRVPITEEGLLGFSKECFGLNVLLAPYDEAYAILCTVDDHYVVVGPSNFVIEAVGGDISLARAEFLSFASDSLWPMKIREYLMNIAQTYFSLEG